MTSLDTASRRLLTLFTPLTLFTGAEHGAAHEAFKWEFPKIRGLSIAPAHPEDTHNKDRQLIETAREFQ